MKSYAMGSLCMPRKEIVILQKMVKYCDNAVKYSRDETYESFVANELYLTFSVFSLSQLGELASRVDQTVSDQFPQIPWQAMRGLRNRIVHDYDGVRHTILWDVLTRDIDVLREQLLDAITTLDKNK